LIKEAGSANELKKGNKPARSQSEKQSGYPLKPRGVEVTGEGNRGGSACTTMSKKEQEVGGGSFRGKVTSSEGGWKGGGGREKGVPMSRILKGAESQWRKDLGGSGRNEGKTDRRGGLTTE